jgi:hypothetical protein
MHITTSNVLLGKVPESVENGENENFDIASVTDPDFSTFYVSSDNSRLTFDFGATETINYVAYAGLNIEGNKDFTSRVRIRDGSTIIATTFVSMNNCVLITFEARTFTNLRIGMFNAKGDTQPRVSFIAAGTAFEVPNGGEGSGYNRQFLNRNIKTKSTLNDIAAPIALLTKKISAKGSLKIPNVTRSFSESTWQDFLDFSSANQFFIREQDPVPVIDFNGETTNNNSAYLCFDAEKSKTTAHSGTRALNNLSVSFKVFNGL